MRKQKLMILSPKSMNYLKIFNFAKILGLTASIALLVFCLAKPVFSQSAQIFYLAPNIVNYNLGDLESQVKFLAQQGKLVNLSEAFAKITSKQNQPRYFILSVSAQAKGFYSEIAPFILDNKIPAIIAISQVPSDAHNANILKKLMQNGAQIAVILPPNLADLSAITAAWQEFLNQQPIIFMTSSGNNSEEINKITNQLKYKYGLGLHGGAISMESNLQILPQNILTAGADGFANLQTRSKYYDLPTKDFLPANLTLNEPIHNLGFTITQNLTNLPKIKCQLNNQTPTTIKIIDQNRVNVNLPSLLGKGLHRLTCTLNTDGVNYWFSRVIEIRG